MKEFIWIFKKLSGTINLLFCSPAFLLFMCGVLGISANSPVNQDLFDGLTVLQHRGQDAAGIATYDGKFRIRKGNGLVRDVFFARHMQRLTGNIGIGHVRYPTAGCNSSWEAQPFFVNSPFGIVLGHNGNLINSDELAPHLFKENLRHLNTNSDSEVLLNMLANKLFKLGKNHLEPEDFFQGVHDTMERIKGSYAVVGIIAEQGLFGFRDPLGLRPLIIGKKETTQGDEYCLASESVVFAPLGYKILRDAEPGEAILIRDGQLYSQVCTKNPKLKPCIFEYIYLARPDSMMDNISVHKARLRMGETLAEKIKKEMNPDDIDIVIPIPESSRAAAVQVAYELGKPYREGFIKNRYIGRTFIMPGQQIRKKSIKYKLSAIDLEFKDKNVLLVDDSIVRGNTSKKIVEMAREAGAKKVFFASAAPPLVYPCLYGVDMPSKKDFVANGLTNEEICKVIGADGLIYQDLDALIEAVIKKGKSEVQEFCTACFTGEYPIGNVTEEYLNEWEQCRNRKLAEDNPHPDQMEESPVTLL